ncbi:hypothetical protein [Nocardia spumae]|uniref:hypothetical protein n=1 Tax=Nocardia spumae TaxID=2887190 RepID=UPI001D152B7D|nr:hypothetical protein [Nocardia spumae]
MLDEQSTGTTAAQSADSAHRSRGEAASSPTARVTTSVPAELSALAQRVATARDKLPLQADPALFAELSDREITAERELAEWIRTQRRRQRKRAVSEELIAEKRDRRVALALRRADESDARWHRRARAARMRVSNSDARLAQLFRRAEWSSRALIGVVILGMVWAGVNVQHNLVPSGDMSDPLYWLSYGFEAMISIPIITIMVVATTAARWGREIDRGKVVFLETALLGVTIALNAGPHLVAGEPARAAEAAVAPVMVGVVIWLHSWVSARYAQLIDDIPVDGIDSDDRPPSGYRTSYRSDTLPGWAEPQSLPASDLSTDFHNYPQLAHLTVPHELAHDEAAEIAQPDMAAPQHHSPQPIDTRPIERPGPAETPDSAVPTQNPTRPADFAAQSAAMAPEPESAAVPPVADSPASAHIAPVPTAEAMISESDSATSSFEPTTDTAAAPAASGSATSVPAEDLSAPEQPAARPAPGAGLRIVSDEPRRTRTRRAVDDAVQLVLGEPIAESPRNPSHAAAAVAATEAATERIGRETRPELSDDRHDDSADPTGTDVDDQVEFDVPDAAENEFDDLESVGADPAEPETGEVAIWSVAREIRRRGLSKLTVEQLAEVLTLTDESWTPAAIGAAVGLPGSRVLGILETARRISMPIAVGG